MEIDEERWMVYSYRYKSIGPKADGVSGAAKLWHHASTPRASGNEIGIT
jgi:hypothetical protein